jgi:hypothetical protein
VAFARANYGLRLQNGRCVDPGASDCRGRYYDPEHLYLAPKLAAQLQYDGSSLMAQGDIPASYGMDFIEVELEAGLDNQPLVIRLRGEGGIARFNVQLWRLKTGEGQPVAVTSQPEQVSRTLDGDHVYVVRDLDTSTYDRLALIITRLDSDETMDPTGAYTILLRSGAQG